MRKTLVLIAALAATTLCLPRVTLVAQPSTGTHPISGRRYAQTMSYRGADWLERSERLREEEPDLALDALKIPTGSTAADVGAGSGYMTIRLARRVGPAGTVYANDIQPEMLSILSSRVKAAGFANVIPVLGTGSDPRLPAATVDLALLVDVYHEFAAPQAMLRRLRESLSSNGRLVLLEYRKEDPSIPILPDHKMSVAEAKLEVEAEGFTLAHVDEVLPRQHILIFTRR